MDLFNSFFGTNDAYSFIWYVWHAQESIRNLNLQELFFTKDMFFPYGADLRYDTYFLYTFITYPIYLLFGPIASYNFITLLTFILTFLGMYLFLKVLTDNKRSAILGAMIFTFSSYRLRRLMMGHLDLISTQGFGFFLYFAYQYFYKNKKNIFFWGMVLTYVLQAYTDYRTFLVLTLTAGYFFAGIFISSYQRKNFSVQLRQISLFIISSIFFLLPLLYFYSDVVGIKYPSAYSDLAYISKNKSADLLDFIIPNRRNSVFLGWLTLAAFFWYLIFGKKARNEKKILWYWGIFGLAFLLLTLGPAFVISGKEIVPLGLMPYAFVVQLPILQFLHAPIRFVLPVFLYLSIMVAFFWHSISKKLKGQYRKYIFGLFVMIALMQYFVYAHPVVSKSEDNPLYKKINEGEFGSVLNIPFGYFNVFVEEDNSYNQQQGLLTQMYHRKPIMGGYANYPDENLYRFFDENPVLKKISDCQNRFICQPFNDNEKRILKEKFELRYILVSDAQRFTQVLEMFEKSYPTANKTVWGKEALLELE
jgi:hypothetical protein